MNTVTPKTEELVQEWIRTRKAVERVKMNLKEAESFLRTAEINLGQWLVPQDHIDGEWFNIWHRSGVLQARSVRDPSQDDICHLYEVGWRKEPDGKDLLERGK